MKIVKSISIDKDLVKKINEKRGKVFFSTYLNDLLRGFFKI